MTATERMFDIASQLETVSFELDSMRQMLSILQKEIFYKQIPDNAPSITLTRYEFSYGCLLNTVVNQLLAKSNELALISDRLYSMRGNNESEA